ncbi:HNH endonuclease [Trueperella bernardiae]|uniref:HNH endonuclease n=1 Tax=Trueperella bernardiae TaxID=59561 RepID=UPI00117DB281|nr:HNH endonuclease [Trueperella bernardiae]MCM3907595.1 HNH endonuclease [Trueperella bernardiae]MDV6239880.1 HNH endonuclease [Trueperella bernardiae]
MADTAPKKPRRVNNYAYRDLTKALRRKAKAHNLPCWICGQPIDYTADWRSRWSFTADHVIPIALGGNPRGELRPAHRACNSRRGDTTNRRQPAIVKPVEKRSKKW